MYDNSPYTDLVLQVGKTFSDNFSSTLRSRLVSVNWKQLSCQIEEVPSEYYPEVKKPGVKRASLDYVHTCFFGR